MNQTEGADTSRALIIIILSADFELRLWNSNENVHFWSRGHLKSILEKLQSCKEDWGRVYIVMISKKVFKNKGLGIKIRAV